MKIYKEKQSLQHYILNEVSPLTVKEVDIRQPFERAITQIYLNNQSLQIEKQAWLEYILFEKNERNNLQRAKLLYERALISLDSDLHFWLQYVDFIQRSLKDYASVRAKFEARKASIGTYNSNDIVELMLENAAFEEEQK